MLSDLPRSGQALADWQYRPFMLACKGKSKNKNIQLTTCLRGSCERISPLRVVNAPKSPKGPRSGQSAVGIKRLIVYLFRADLVPQLQVHHLTWSLADLCWLVTLSKTNMKHILHQRYFQVCAALIAADCLVFTQVNPWHAPALWLIAGFILFGLTLLAMANAVAQVFKSYGDKAYITSKRILRYAAIMVVILVGLQSVGQLTTKDVLTFLPFAVILYLYYGYGRRLAMDSP